MVITQFVNELFAGIIVSFYDRKYLCYRSANVPR